MPRPSSSCAGAALLACLATVPAAAHAPAHAAAPRVALEVVDTATGAPFAVHRHAGRRWIAGEPGREYAIRLRNRSPHRVLAVVSVDGVNVITGETASPAQSGYVLEPWGEVAIDGWRKSLARVAAFEFARLDDSYAALTGRPHDVGVIGVAVYAERAVRPRHDLPPAPLANAVPAEPLADAAPAPAAEAASAAPPSPAAPRTAERSRGHDSTRLGTGHGRGLDSPAVHTRFERATATPAAIHALHYDSRGNLVARGVLPPPRAYEREPRPFPAGFVPDP